MFNAHHNGRFEPSESTQIDAQFNPLMVRPDDEKRVALAARALRAIVRVASYLNRQQRIWITASHLRRLDDRTLRDIGVERDQIETVVRDRSVNW